MIPLATSILYDSRERLNRQPDWTISMVPLEPQREREKEMMHTNSRQNIKAGCSGNEESEKSKRKNMGRQWKQREKQREKEIIKKKTCQQLSGKPNMVYALSSKRSFLICVQVIKENKKLQKLSESFTRPQSIKMIKSSSSAPPSPPPLFTLLPQINTLGGFHQSSVHSQCSFSMDVTSVKYIFICIFYVLVPLLQLDNDV